jgi:hypothetical protein
LGDGRFRYFPVGYKDTDLWIGVDAASFNNEMRDFALDKIKFYRKQLEDYLLIDPNFGKTLLPITPKSEAPDIAKSMANATAKCEVGPMAAVAGAFAAFIGIDLIDNFKLEEVVVENGGDIFLNLVRPITISVFAGNSPFSGKIGIEIPQSVNRIGVCTSAGKVGPSLSFGKADAVMVACNDTALADAWATALANKIKSTNDIEKVLNDTEKVKEIRSIIVICDGKMGIRGEFEMKLTR